MVTSLAAGFALAAQPVSAQTITTDTSGLEAGEVKIPVTDGEIPAYRALPAGGGPFPVILVVQEIFGVHEHIKDICRRLAKLGYLAVAPELYARQGDVSKIDEHPGDHLQGRLQGPRRPGDVRPRRDRRLGQGDRQRGCGQARHHRLLLGRADRLALLGAQSQSQGGRRLVRPAGQRRRTSSSPSTRSTWSARSRPPCSGLYGEADQGIPVASVEKMRAALKEAGKTAEIVALPRHAACLLCRLSAQLSQGRGRGRLEADARVVQEVRRGLTSQERHLWLRVHWCLCELMGRVYAYD